MGGRFDPKTGEIIWEVHVPIEEQKVFYQEHPPTVLSELSVRSIELPDCEFDGHGEPVNSIFEVACSCGCKYFFALAYINQDGGRPRITLECDECGTEYLLFDAGIHGYDGHLRSEDTSQEVLAESDELCGDGLEPPYRIAVRFEFPSDMGAALFPR